MEYIKVEGENEKWEEFNNSALNSTFLTSVEWINFQKSLGKEIQQYFVYDNADLIALLYIEISRRKIAKYAYLPYAPIVKNDIDLKSFYNDLRDFGKKFCRENGLNLFKIDPLLDKNDSYILENSGWKKSLGLGQAKDTWVMDISKDSDSLLKDQKKDTRYYINRGIKAGLKTIKVESEEQVNDFLKIMRETKDRKGFENFSDNYYLNQWKTLNQKGLSEIFVSYFNDKPVSCALMNYYKDTVYYSHAGSTSDPELMKLAAPYSMHWSIMKDAHDRGFKKYNFWGVVPKGINHDWRGLSDFKMKFNGEQVSYTGPYEVYDSFIKYFINRLFDYWAFRKERY